MSSGRRFLVAVGVSLLVALVALVVFLLLVVGRASTRIDVLNQDGQVRDRAITALAGAVSTEQAQVRQLGGTPNVPPPQAIISAIPGATGQQGPGPSDAQVQSAVNVYLLAHPPSGTVPAAQVEAQMNAFVHRRQQTIRR